MRPNLLLRLIIKSTPLVIGVAILLAQVSGVVQAGPATPSARPALPAAQMGKTDGLAKVDPAVQAALRLLGPNDTLTVIVTLKDQMNLTGLDITPTDPRRPARLKYLVNRLKNRADLSQQALKTLLKIRQTQGRAGKATYFWIFNGLAVTATADVILELAARPEVSTITLNRTIKAPPPPVGQDLGIFTTTQPNLSLINIPALWNLGFRGQGVVIATLDTGVSISSHPDLANKWRGGANSWFDPYGQHPTTPTDVNGHGTRTMGVIVGSEDNGVAFGVAPEAKWIAAKIFKDNDTGTAVAIHQAFQWLLDPDGNPSTDDAPHVVNNSWIWYQGCHLEFQADLQALRAAGILPVFAAGNSALTSHSPANYPEAFAVGATDNNDLIWANSSRGPSACDGTIFPEVVAPGVSIHTTSLYGTYYNATGTSVAAPHVTGAVALLLDASPNLTTAQQENALLASSKDLGAAGADNTYGYGRIDVLAALQSIGDVDLQVTQTALPNPAISDYPLAYTITIKNSGPLTAAGVTLDDTLPSPATIGPATPSQGSCTGPLGNSLTCNLGNIASGATATVTLVVTPTTSGITLTNTVDVTGSKTDFNPDNNSNTNDITVLTAEEGLKRVFLPFVTAN